MQASSKLLRRTPVIIRIDGKAFHTFTRGFEKPFDKFLVRAMQFTTKKLCENIQGCVIGYTQSDEITLVLVDYKNLDTCAWFENKVQKMVSVSASMATLYFNQYLHETLNKDMEQDEFQFLCDKRYKAMFDSRVFNVPLHEVVNNLIWRQQDAERNSIQGLAQSLYPHKEIEGLSCNELQDKMFTEKGVNWNDLPVYLRRGSCVIKKDNEWVVDREIPRFTEDRDYIFKLVDPEVICNEEN